MIKPTSLTFKNHLHNVYYATDVTDENQVRLLLTGFERLNISLNRVAPLLFAIDYTQSKYLLMNNGCQLITGNHPQDFLEGGIPVLLDLYQKDDFKVYNENVFTSNSFFLKSQPATEHHKFVFSYNFRVRSKSGKYIPIYQRGLYITSKETGLPLYSLGTVQDISLFKKDNVMYHTIEKIEECQGTVTSTIIAENCFFPDAEDKILSRHERRILEAMAEGWSSKQIAGKFKISENTVSNHRKNMMKKTNTKNVAELVAFGCKNKLI
jgi:DNA-binding CsgD family transcriptional regulator/uncharacterized protein affecting Mg2+/Co2+ transport